MRQYWYNAALLMLVLSASANAQAVAPQQVVAPNAAAMPVPPVSTIAVPSTGNCQSCIPALTPVELVIEADLGSKISTTGETFAIRLAKAIVIDGREVIPAGTTGQGEVVHAKKAGGSGASGELVLAARYLDFGDRRLKLRSLRVGLAGRDAMQAALAVSTLATPLGFILTGRNVDFAKGTVAMAKTSEPFMVDIAVGSVPDAKTETIPAQIRQNAAQ